MSALKYKNYIIKTPVLLHDYVSVDLLLGFEAYTGVVEYARRELVSKDYVISCEGGESSNYELYSLHLSLRYPLLEVMEDIEETLETVYGKHTDTERSIDSEESN